MRAHPFGSRIARVEGALDQVNERLGSIDRRLDSIASRFNALDSCFGAIDSRLHAMDTRFNWIIGTIVGTWLTMISTQIATTLTILSHR